MFSYRIDVKPVLENVGGSVDVSDVIDAPELVVGDHAFALLEPAAFRVTVSNAGAGIVAYGSVSARVAVTCSRCLCTFEDVLEGEVVGFYLRSGDETSHEEEAEQVDSEGAIDIGPALMAALVIEAPFAPLHDPECAGLCATCGADLNTETCSCDQAASDEHPFAALKSLLDEADDTD